MLGLLATLTLWPVSAPLVGDWSPTYEPTLYAELRPDLYINDTPHAIVASGSAPCVIALAPLEWENDPAFGVTVITLTIDVPGLLFVDVLDAGVVVGSAMYGSTPGEVSREIVVDLTGPDLSVRFSSEGTSRVLSLTARQGE